jgi:hypothetical protein
MIGRATLVSLESRGCDKQIAFVRPPPLAKMEAVMHISQRFRKSAIALAAAGAAAAGGVVVTASPAMAAPSDCHGQAHYTVPGEYYAWCNKGTGYVRAVGYCGATPTSSFQYVFGAWVGAGPALSSITCPKAKPYIQGGFADY